ncbi:DUF2232 domain-containing protein [Alkaliphilus hydrothermalis]|nr:DUF2232 domain-containing protein [Alkaliphilus hydrothermalis]
MLSNRRALMESIIIAVMVSLYAISLYYIPLLYLVLFLIPVPFMVLTTKYNIKYGVLSFFIASLIIGFLIDIVFAVLLIFLFGPIALVMGSMIKKRIDDFIIIGIGTAISIFTVFLLIQLVSIVGEFNFINEISTLLQDALQHQKNPLMEMNIQADDVKYYIDYFLILFPSIVIIHSIFLTFINYYVTTAILNKLKFEDVIFSEFSYFKLPENIVLGAFIIMLLSYFTRYFDGLPTDSLMSNVLLIFTFVFFFQGLSVASFFLKNKKLPLVLRIIILAIVAAISPLLIFVAMVGLFDSLTDMRKIRVK